MLQSPESVPIELLKVIGVPLAQVLGTIIILKKWVIPPPPDLSAMATTITAELTRSLAVALEANEQHQDLVRTAHFDQLRRDLSTTIEKATENAIMRYLWETERRRGKS